jgi:hypothetical protein
MVRKPCKLESTCVKSNLDDSQKSLIINKITDVDQSLIKGCDEYIQFMRLVYYIVGVI